MTSRPRLLNIFAKAAMDLSRSIVSTELLESVVHQLIDEETLGVSLEMHRAINLGYYELLYPNDRYLINFCECNKLPMNVVAAAVLSN